jgi:hypothetical protein
MKKIIFSIFALAAMAFIFSACTNHGEKVDFKNLEVYYKDGAEKEDAEKLGKYLEPLFVDHAETVTFQILKSGDNFVVRFVVKEGYEEREDFVSQFKALQAAISEEVFDGAAVDVHLCDANLETKKEIKWGE